MLDSIGSSVLVWGTIVSMAPMGISPILSDLEPINVNTVIPSVFYLFQDNCRFFILIPLTCSLASPDQIVLETCENVNLDLNCRSFPIPKMVTSHFAVVPMRSESH